MIHLLIGVVLCYMLLGIFVAIPYFTNPDNERYNRLEDYELLARIVLWPFYLVRGVGRVIGKMMKGKAK